MGSSSLGLLELFSWLPKNDGNWVSEPKLNALVETHSQRMIDMVSRVPNYEVSLINKCYKFLRVHSRYASKSNG